MNWKVYVKKSLRNNFKLILVRFLCTIGPVSWTMSRKFFCQITLMILISAVALEKLNYSFKIIKIQCYNFNTSIVRMDKCEIVARRGTPGLVNVVAYYEGATDLQDHLIFYYRGTSGKYQPYLVDVILDACVHTKHTNPILQLACKYFTRFDSGFGKGCPLKGPFNTSFLNIQTAAEEIFPPVIPGLYFVSCRTFWEII